MDKQAASILMQVIFSINWFACKMLGNSEEFLMSKDKTEEIQFTLNK